MGLAFMENDLILQIESVLEGLGEFGEDAPREAKWLTTEQLANRLWSSDASSHLKDLDDLLSRYEAIYRVQLESGLQTEARIRRAVYPDRTTALPLWGLTRRHGQPWLNKPTERRTDPPDDIPDSRRVSASAPHVFLSHSNIDQALGTEVAEALAQMDIGTWMFETNIGHGQNIAGCVRDAIAGCSCCLLLVTRDSIASLWVLTELHNALNIGKRCFLIINSDDDLLLNLLQSLDFRYPDSMFDTSVRCNAQVLAELNTSYVEKEKSKSRTERYLSQVADFLATLPLYLDHFRQPVFVFSKIPSHWSGPFKLSPLGQLRDLMSDSNASIPPSGAVINP
jgi:hypothetical protein